MKKYEGLLDEKLDSEEKLKYIQEIFDRTREKIGDQDGLIDHLKGEIEG